MEDIHPYIETNKVLKLFGIKLDMFKILEKNQLAPEVFRYLLQAPDIAKKVLPGQFVIIRLDETGERYSDHPVRCRSDLWNAHSIRPNSWENLHGDESHEIRRLYYGCRRTFRQSQSNRPLWNGRAGGRRIRP